MSSASFQISMLLEKMMSMDKDFRFMATNDLMSELQKDSIKLDDDSERKVVKMLLKLLEDKNGEVQNLAVKCLGPLVNKVKEFQVECIVEALCANMLSDNEQLRDISSIGLKTVISELPLGSNALAANVCKKITGRLSSAIEKQEDVSVQLEALDILSDLLSRFGGLLLSFHPVLLTSLLPQLGSPRQAVRKRTIMALSHLVMSCNSTLYNQLIEHLLTGMNNSTQAGISRTYIQCIASICRQAGHRFGEQVCHAAPSVLRHARDDDDDTREHTLLALEAFVLRCPKEVSPIIPTVIELCLEMITYDPNYNYEEEEDVEDEADEYNDENDENNDTHDDDSDDYSDDDDMSWKVRRAAAKCLESVISTRNDVIDDIFHQVSPALIARFKEREENVKCDVLSAYCSLVRASARSQDAADHLEANIGSVIKASLKVIRAKQARARPYALSVLRELLAVRPNAVLAYSQQVLKSLTPHLTDPRTSNMKLETLTLVRSICTVGEGALQSQVDLLAPALLAAADDPFYKITAEALRAMQALLKVIRPNPPEPIGEGSVKFIPLLYKASLIRLRATDIDQEVKECAITTTAQLLCYLADYLKAELRTCLPIFLERLRNEITRLTTVKAFISIASSPLNIDLNTILPEAIPILGSFLRKNQRPLKLATLMLLETLIEHYYKHMHVELLSLVLMELPPLMNGSDMHCAQLALNVLSAAGEKRPDSLNSGVRNAALPAVVSVAVSPFLQGGALRSLLRTLRALVAGGAVGATALQTALVNAGCNAKPPSRSLARCVATVSSDPLVTARVLLGGHQENDHDRAFALLCVAELGRNTDLSSIDNIKETLLAAFSHPSEEVKTSASYALGSVAIANLANFLPFILNEIQAQPKKQYLLLHSLKEVISWHSGSEEGVETLRQFIPGIWSQLSSHTQCTEEGSRNVVSECLGKLCLLEPRDLLPRLQTFLQSPEPLTRITAVTAIKYTISDQPAAIDPILADCLSEFLWMARDSSPAVRRAALVALHCAAHNKPTLVRPLLPTLLPLLYTETNINKELIREVEMGPFKHTVDDGLDLRKAAFECMYTLLNNCLDCLDIYEFLRHVELGLRDHYDIKMLTYLMCARLAQLCPNVVLQRLEGLVEPLKQTCITKVKANSVKQEYEKNDELRRAALRATSALLAIPEADKNPHLMEFIAQIKSTSDLQPIFESILKDSTGTNTIESNLMDQS